MIYAHVLINILLLVLINSFLIKKNYLIHKTYNFKHKTEYKKKITLSGGLYFLLTLIINIFYNEFLFTNLLIYSLIFFILGIFSDINSFLKPLDRLFLMFIFSLIILSDEKFRIFEVDIFIIDYFIKYETLSILFFSCCLVILINGSNFIDGTNGNAVGFYILCILSLTYQFYKLDVIEKEMIFVLLMINPFLIFFFLNLMNKNFLGDNGVYFISAFFGLLIISSYSSNYLNTMYVVNLFLYPAFEVFSSFVRKIIFKSSPYDPDLKHLHHLISIFFKKFLKEDEINNITSFFILFLMSIFFIFINYDSNHSIFQLKCTILFILTYTVIYVFLYNFLKIKK